MESRTCILENTHSLERDPDYRGFGLERFHCTTIYSIIYLCTESVSIKTIAIYRLILDNAYIVGWNVCSSTSVDRIQKRDSASTCRHSVPD